MYLRFLKFLLLLLIPFASLAQELNFKHISFNEGLAKSPIAAFLQDEKGFIWFGTAKGLTRYDGYEFINFKTNLKDTTTLSHNRVNVIFQDSEKRLWIGTANGLNLYDRKLEKFIHVDIRDLKGGQNYISSIVEDKEKNIWIGTFGGLKKLNKKTFRLEDALQSFTEEVLKTGVIFSLLVDKYNKIWLGTEKGIKIFDPQREQNIELPSILIQTAGFQSNIVRVIKEDSKGNLWFGTEISGVLNLDRINNKVNNYVFAENKNSISSNWVNDILFYENQIWFATRNGISVFDTITNVFTTYKNSQTNNSSLSDDVVWSLLKDKESCVWVGTFSGSIDFYYKGNSNFENISTNTGKPLSLNNALVESVIEDKDGSLYVGTFRGGLNYLNRATYTSNYFPIRPEPGDVTNNGVKSLADDGKGNLWVGTIKGLALFGKQSQTYKYFDIFKDRPSKSDHAVLCLLPDGDGAWVGTDGYGLMYVLSNGITSIYKTKGATQYNTKPKFNFSLELNPLIKWAIPEEFFPSEMNYLMYGIADNFVTALLKANETHLWIGTQDGLNYYNKETNIVERLYQKLGERKYQLNNSNVSTLFRDSKKRLWVGVQEGGVNYFDELAGRFYNIGIKEGLKDDVIRSIVEDADTNIWVSTDLGIFKIAFKKFSPPFKKEDLVITQYTSNDGLVNNQFSTQAGQKLMSDEIVFGGINGLSIFYPDRILKNDVVPKVVLTNLGVNNVAIKPGNKNSPLKASVLEAEVIKLKYYQSSLTIKYAALNYINPENNLYAYKVLGLNTVDNWQMVGTQRIVNLTNLTPGTYEFMVKASNNDGIWGSNIRTLKIIILPPWWQAWWAYLIYLIIFSLIAYVIITFLKNRELLKRSLYIEHLQNERQNELYQMKLDFFTNISHELRTPLTLIMGPIEKLLYENPDANSLKSLNSIKSNAGRLMDLVTELLDFRKVEEGHLKLYWTYQDIIPFCEEMFKSFETLANFKQIKYRFEPIANPTFIYFDAAQLQKVIFNLLSNAFKFTNSGGTIILKVDLRKEDSDTVEISVTDTGKGIPKHFHDKLFDSFFQVDDRGTANVGSGIGLALAKSIMELHKGEITVSSVEYPTKQTCFTISLKTGKKHIESADLFVEKNVDAEVLKVAPPILEKAVEIAKSGGNSKSLKIMIVEDNNEVRELIADTLKEDYQVITCENGKVALDCIANELPDLIVSDVMMPELDGLELCSIIKTNEETNHIPVILLTAKAAEANQLTGLNTGADVYITKPFRLQILKANIRNLLNAQAVLREKFSQRMVLSPTNTPVTDPEEKFIAKLMKIIDEKLADSEFGVNELVNEIGMSRAALYKKVQTLTNYAVADFIKQMRLKKAAFLLQSTTFNVNEITYMVGFNRRKHFSTEFKKQYNLSPSEYAKLNQDSAVL
jgi:signal transduction histidine kinase/ligand-binding sensor domain-containing protein/DNA-binding response OmpR family regulator